VRPFIILYLLNGDQVIVARIVHGARDLRRLIADEPAGDG